MELNEYTTNVLSSSNFARVDYEYYEISPNQRANLRKDLHSLEKACRIGGRLVHCDPLREGIWSFQPSDGAEQPGNTLSLASLAESLGLKIIEKERGVYEPSSTVKSRQLTATNLSAGPGNSLSPSLEGTLRNSQTTNARAVQQNFSHGTTAEQSFPSPGAKPSSGSADQTSSQQNIHEYIISAVLGAITQQLCHNSGFLPLNTCTLILPAHSLESNIKAVREGISEVMIATLDVSLTSLGSLVVKARPDFAPFLRSIHDDNSRQSGQQLKAGASLWLAPGGIAARYYGISGEESLDRGNLVEVDSGSISTHRNTSEISEHRTVLLKSKCLEWMTEQGLRIDRYQNDSWIFVQVLNGRSTPFDVEPGDSYSSANICVIPWPTSLCYEVSAEPSIQSTLYHHMSTRYQDPLYFAERWFTGRDERSATLAKRHRERTTTIQSAEELVESESRAVQLHASSPVALRRSSNAGNMYPTPPDALHHPLGATPSIDGNVSTPGNTSAFHQHDGNNMPSSQPAPPRDSEAWIASETKDRPPVPDVFNDNDDLFGEIDGDYFGTDVTDADFSFFDQPDVLPSKSAAAATDDHLFDEPDSLHAQIDFGAMDMNLDSDVEMTAVASPTIKHENHRSSETPVNASEVSQSPLSGSKTKDTNQEVAPVSLGQGQRSPTKSPTFNKEVVFERMFGQQDKPNSFNNIKFQKSLASSDGKYKDGGHFGYAVSKRKRPPEPLQIHGLPRTDYLIRSRKPQPQSFVGRKDGDHDDLVQNQSNIAGLYVDSDQSSPISDVEYTHQFLETAYLDTKIGADEDKKDGMMILAPSENIVAAVEAVVQTPQSTVEAQPSFLNPDPAAWPLTSYLLWPLPNVSTSLSDFERIAAAQIIADQAASGTLQLHTSSLAEIIHSSKQASKLRRSLRDLVRAVGGCLVFLRTCTLRAYLDIQGIPVVQGLRLPPRQTPAPRGLTFSELGKTNNPFMIQSPRLELRRADSKLSVLPSAVEFWDKLGLSPSAGNKDIFAVCVYPSMEGVALYANTFLDQMRSLYESLRLGTHERLITKELTYGLLPFTLDLNQKDDTGFLGVLKETIGRLGRVFASYPVEEKNLLVYFVYPPNDAGFLAHVCSAFQHLFTMYRKALSEKKMSTVNELVLQLVPLNLISSPHSLVVPASSRYSHLAVEVYDRCVDFDSSSSSPAILLEQPLPKVIDFKLSANPSVALLQENTCLHIAYAQSIDDRWITAAWTDNKGSHQMTASYCLGRKNEQISMPFSDIAEEIWATTLDYIASKKIHWRVIIVRAGVMDNAELEAWTKIAAGRSDSNVSLTLVAAKASPSLCLISNSITLIPNAAPTHAVLTPASTPQPTQTTFGSQESASTPTRDVTTPSAGETSTEPDKDAYLIDYTDQTWGAVLSHRLNNANSLLELNPALVSGYLIKRSGINSDDSPVLLEVSVIYSDIVGNPRTFHESLLREILGYYRGLGTLARVRGVVDSVSDCRPWHIAAAEKAVQALYVLL